MHTACLVTRAEPSDRHLSLARSDARDELLRDSESFTNWLSGECNGAPVGGAITKRGAHILMECDGFETNIPRLVALAMDFGQSDTVRRYCLDRLADAYCAQPDIAALIEERASLRVGELAEEERELHRAAA